MRSNVLQVENGKVVIHLDLEQAVVIQAALEEAYEKLPEHRGSLLDLVFGISNDRKSIGRIFLSALRNALDQLKEQATAPAFRVLRLDHAEAGFVMLALVPMRDTVIARHSGTKSGKGRLTCFDVALAQLPTTYQIPEWITQSLFGMIPGK
jgi:hypothetical protein